MTIKYFISLVFTKAILNLRSEASRTYLSYIWWVLEPVLYIAVFYLVFGVLLNNGTPDYINLLLTGLIPWLWFAKSVTNASGSIVSGRELMLQIHIPKLFFPAVILAQDFLKQLSVFLVLFVALILLDSPATSNWLYAIALIPLQLFLIAGISLLAAFITPFIPDFRLLLNTGLTLLMFGSGVFYSPDRIDSDFLPYFFLNPMASIIQLWREILLTNTTPDPRNMLYVFLISAITFFSACVVIWRYDRILPRVVLEK